MPHLGGQLRLVVFAEVVHLAELVRDAARCVAHFQQQVVRVDHGAFAGLHLALRQFHHAVAEVVVGLRLGKSKFLEDQEQHLEVVFLFVAHGVHLAVEVGEVGKPRMAVPMSWVM